MGGNTKLKIASLIAVVAIMAFGGYLFLKNNKKTPENKKVVDIGLKDNSVRTTPEDFIPQGWTVWAKTEGDLNGDGVADTVMVLEQGDHQNIVGKMNEGVISKDQTIPRSLLVLLKTTNGYKLSVSSDRAISDFRYASGLMFGQATISDNILSLSFSENAGIREGTTLDVSFKYLNNYWYLIKASETKGSCSQASAEGSCTNTVLASRDYLAEGKKPDALFKLSDFDPDTFIVEDKTPR